MMGSFMRFCKKIKPLFYIGLIASLWLWQSVAFANSNILIKGADLQPQEDHYVLSVLAELELDTEMEDALSKGVPLNFLIEFQIVSPRKYWFDDEIVTVSQNVMLSFHALTRQYLVNRNGHQQSFDSLAEAKKALMMVKDWRVVDKSLLEKNEVYNAAVQIHLDQKKLPKAIQVDTIASEKWNLISPKFEWPLKDLNK
jgi:Domain of unknown function (DUF4390)